MTLSGDGPSSASQFDLGDGFAEVAPWLDDDTPVFTVEEPTKRAFLTALTLDDGPRVISFETSGTIDLEGEWLSINNGPVWIVGQTAPSLGITFVRGRLGIETDDVILQHVRVRPGDEGGGSPDSMDAIFIQDEIRTPSSITVRPRGRPTKRSRSATTRTTPPSRTA